MDASRGRARWLASHRAWIQDPIDAAVLAVDRTRPCLRCGGLMRCGQRHAGSCACRPRAAQVQQPDLTTKRHHDQPRVVSNSIEDGRLLESLHQRCRAVPAEVRDRAICAQAWRRDVVIESSPRRWSPRTEGIPGRRVTAGEVDPREPRPAPQSDDVTRFKGRQWQVRRRGKSRQSLQLGSDGA